MSSVSFSIKPVASPTVQTATDAEQHQSPIGPDIIQDDSSLVRHTSPSSRYRVDFLRVPAKRDTEHVGGISRTVWDLSQHVPDEPAIGVPGLRAVRANEIFKPGVFALQFGLPNTAMFEVTDNNEVFKVDAKSLHRAPTHIINAHGKIQSGWYIVPKDLPMEALERVRVAAHMYEGSTNLTCVRANTNILRDAGFTIGGYSPSTFLPHHLLDAILTNGFEYDTKPVTFSIARTTPLNLHDFMAKLPAAIRETPYRHWNNVRDTPEARELRIREAAAIHENRPVYKPILFAQDAPVFDFSISKTSNLGRVARRAWGAHPVYKVDFSQAGINIDDYLPRKLTAFSMPNPSRLTRFKKNAIFSSPVVGFVNKHMARQFLSQEPLVQLDITQLLKTSTLEEPSIYNVVVTSKEMIAGKLNIWSPKVDWVLSKHVLLSNYSDDVRFAGEMWKDENDCIHFNANSGTYQPTEEDLQNMLKLARKMFPDLNLQAGHLAGRRILHEQGLDSRCSTAAGIHRPNE